MRRQSPAIFLGIFILGAFFPLIGHAEPIPRVAILDFTSDDHYYRSSVAAGNFTAALQTSLFERKDFQWVERAQMLAAMDELNLSVLNLSSGASIVRLGKWVKADLVVLGRFIKVDRGKRKLMIEVIDADRADILAGEELVIPGDTRDAVPLANPDIEAAGKMIQKILSHARRQMERPKTQVLVAPLFFRNISDTSRLDYLEQDLVNTLSASVPASGDVRVLRFLRTRQALAEAQLVVLGLVDTNPKAWQRVADMYVWGSYKEEKSPGLSFDQVPVSMTITLSNGRSELKEITKRVKVGRLSEALKDIAREILLFAGKKSSSGTGPESKSDVAMKLLDRAREIEISFDGYGRGNQEFLGSNLGKSLRRNLIETLEVARFFDPGNRDLHEKVLTVRWGSYVTYFSSPLDFLSKWEKFVDYEQYKMAFGLLGKDHRINSWLIRNYMATIQNILWDLRQREHLENFPIDVPETVCKQWQNRFAREFVNTARQVVNQSGSFAEGMNDYSSWLICLDYMEDPKIKVDLVETIWPVYKPHYMKWNRGDQNSLSESLEDKILKAYEEVGRPERVKELLSYNLTPTPTATPVPQRSVQGNRISPILPPRQWSGSPMGYSYPAPVPGKVKKRNIKPNQWISKVPDAVSSVRCILFTPPQTMSERLMLEKFGGVGDTRTLPTFYQVEKLLFSQNRLWISYQIKKTWEYDNPSSPPFLSCYVPADDSLFNVSKMIGEHSLINDLYYSDGKIWLALAFDGVWSLNPETLAVRRFTGKEGLLTLNMRTVTRSENRLLFGGTAGQGGYKVNFYDVTSGKWGEQSIQMETPPVDRGGARLQPIPSGDLCAFKQWVLVGGGRKILLDIRTNVACDFNGIVGISASASEKPKSSGWFSSLFSSDSSSIPPPPRIESIKASVADNDGFWVGASKSLIHFNPETKAIEKVSLEDIDVYFLAGDDEILWVACTVPFDRYLVKAPRNGRESYGRILPREPEKYYLLAWHKQEKRWIGKIEIPAKITALAVSPNSVWVATGQPDRPVLEINKRGFFPSITKQGIAKVVPGRKFNNLREAVIAGDLEQVRKMVKSTKIVNASDRFGVTPLMEAACTGNSEMVLLLIRLGAEVDKGTPGGWTPLMAAARYGYLEIVKILADHGADIKGNQGEKTTHSNELNVLASPLLLAGENGQTPVVKFLLDGGVNMESANLFGQTALWLAAKNSRTETVKFLLARNAEPDSSDLGQATPLFMAAEAGNLELIRLLLDRGARVNAVNNLRQTPLHGAVENGHSPAVKLLLEKGADPGRIDGWDCSVLEKAVFLDNIEILKLLLEYHADKKLSEKKIFNLLRETISRNKSEFTDCLLEGISNFNLVDKDDGSLLEVIAGRGDVALFKKALAHGANINMKNGDTTVGAKSLLGATSIGAVKIVEILLGKGVNTEARDFQGCTPLMKAAQFNQMDILCLLLKAKADIAAVDSNGKTVFYYAQGRPEVLAVLSAVPLPKAAKVSEPVSDIHKSENPWLLKRELIQACREGSVTKVRQLIHQGADPNTKDKASWPVLTLAAARGETQVVKVLLENKADIAGRGVGNWTALMEAAGNNHADTVKLLIDFGASVQDENKWGKTALDIAEERKFPEVVNVLEQANARKGDIRALIEAVNLQNKKVIEILVTSGMDINGIGDDGKTPLFFALEPQHRYESVQEYMEILQWVLSHGANPNISDRQKETPLMIAVRHQKSPEIIKLLLDHGAKVDVTDKSGKTLLRMAEDISDGKKREEIITLLKQTQK